MSLILEALKKSEQQRRLGELPSLSSPPPGGRRRRSLLPVFAGLIALALAAGWWLLRDSAAPRDTAVASVSEAPPAAAARTSAAPAATVKEADEWVPNLPREAAAKRPRTATQPPARRNATQGAKRGQSDVEQAAAQAGVVLPDPEQEAAGSVKAPANELTTSPHVGASGDVTPEQARTRAEEWRRPVRPAPKIETIAESAAPTGAQAAGPAPRARQQVAAATPALPLIWDLPWSIRRNLPELKLTMHVFDPDPAQRFVVVNDERHVEGDTIGDGLVLQQIRPDGMQLTYQGQRFLYPRDGR